MGGGFFQVFRGLVRLWGFFEGFSYGVGLVAFCCSFSIEDFVFCFYGIAIHRLYTGCYFFVVLQVLLHSRISLLLSSQISSSFYGIESQKIISISAFFLFYDAGKSNC